MKHLVIILSIFAMAIGSDTKIGGTTYFDYTSGKMGKDESTSAFNFKRQYISFSGKSSENIKYKVILDVGRTNKNDGEDPRLHTFLKKAQIDYKISIGKISMGLIGLNTYNVQEKNWGYRFIEKSALDKNGFTSTADLGIGLTKELSEKVNLSLLITNGEGYKKPQSDKYHKISLNATYGERKLNKNDGYNLGFVYSTEASDTDPTTMLSVFGGIAGNGFRFGGEYDLLTTSDNTTELILSFTGNYKLNKNIDIFTRYDLYDSDIDSNDDDEIIPDIISGILLNCGDGLTIAPNIKIKTIIDQDDPLIEKMVNFQFKF